MKWIEAKYRQYVSNIKWNIENNSIQGERLEHFKKRLEIYNEFLDDLEQQAKIEIPLPIDKGSEGVKRFTLDDIKKALELRVNRNSIGYILKAFESMTPTTDTDKEAVVKHNKNNDNEMGN